MSNEKSKERLQKELALKLQQLNEKEQLEGLIKDNKIPFEVKGIKYRVHKPTNAEGLQVRKARTKKYIELLKDDTYMLREQLIDLYKGKGVDIKQLEEDIKEINLQIEDIQEKVAPIPTESKKLISNYEQQVKDLIQKQSKIAIRLSELLEYSVENEILEFSNLYLIYSVLEKEIDDVTVEVKEEDNYPKIWVKCFKTYEDFLNSDNETLILEATYNLSMLVFKAKI